MKIRNPKYPFKQQGDWDKCPACFEDFSLDPCTHCGSGFDDEYIEISSELEQLRQRVAELETQLAKNNPLLDEAADAIDKLTAERDALKQQRDELVEAQQWQPIDTAPKTGLFLVHRKHTEYPIVAHVYKPYGSICDYVFGELLHNVTHWMPLPPAPVIASLKEK